MVSNEYCVALSTASSQTEAESLARGLVEHRLAACVQLLPITSFYTWQGQVEQSGEVLLVIKTTGSAYPQLEQYITRNHSYDVPEIVQLPVERGLERYLGWVRENTI